MPAHPATATVPRSLVWATDLDVLPLDRIVARRAGYLEVRSPSNPGHYWGNMLLFDQAPRSGDGPRWERMFDWHFADEPRIEHRTFAWDRSDDLGQAREEFLARGYALEENVGLTASAGEVRAHPRANHEVEIHTLEPRAGADEELWEQVLELQVASRDEQFDEAVHREFSRRRLDDLRRLLLAGRGAWFVALAPGAREVAGSLGVVVAGARARFQAVDTAMTHRRRGICSRLVVEAVQRTQRQHGARRFVIAADPGYHALGLYESLGFRQTERVGGVCRHPGLE